MPFSLLKALWGFILENIKLILTGKVFPLAAEIIGCNSEFIVLLLLTKATSMRQPSDAQAENRYFMFLCC